MSGRHISLGMVLLLLAPFVGPAETPARLWQDGELLSRKTVPMGRTFLRNRFVYRVRASNRRYVVVCDAPLQLDLYVPMKFAIERRHIFIQDADGKERRAHILRDAPPRNR